MNKATSIYLDAVRFLAALAVFLSHAAGQRHTGGFFWQVVPYANTAVVVFFVLSGYVIAHVTATREKDAFAYAASRFGRLYSVVVPALLITGLAEYLVLDGETFIPYSGFWDAVRHHLATLFFVNQFWFIGNLEPLLNPPFWSLSFEVTYYIAAGLLIFGKGPGRFVALGLLAVLAGPAIVSLAPVWLLGYLIYHHGRRLRLGFWPALILWGASAYLLYRSVDFDLIRFVNVRDLSVNLDNTYLRIISTYIAAAAFTAHLIAFDSLAPHAEPLLARYERPIRWFGSLTFALYLLHYPLLHLFSGHPIAEPATLLERIWVMGGTFLVVCVLGPLMETSKSRYRQLAYAARRLWTKGAAAKVAL